MKTRRMNRWDSMLAWLSSEPYHKWENVKTAGQRMSVIQFPDREWTPLRHAMEWAGVLIRLGHAEFYESKRVVAAVPPGLLTLQSSDKAILYGYWDPSLRKKLNRMRLKHWQRVPKRGPSCHAIRVNNTQIDEVSQSLGVWNIADCSVALLQRLPELSSVLADLESSHVASGGYWERFDYRSNLYGRWRGCEQPLLEPGLYQRKEGQPIQVYVSEDHRQFTLRTFDEKLAAKWSVYAPRFDWAYDAQRRVLLIPDGTPGLPVLVSRGLTMRSARLPTRVSLGGRMWWKYGAVDEQQALEAARIMEQVLSARSIESV